LSSSEIPSPKPQTPLVELAALQSFIDAEVLGVLGCLIPPGARCFQTARWFSLNVGPRSRLKDRVHPLLSCASPSEYIAACHLPDTRKYQNASSRVSFPFATPARGVHSSPGFPYPTSVRPQRFSRSRRLTPPRALRACFIPQPRPGFTLQGLSPPPSRLVSSTSRSLMSLARVTSWRVAPPMPDQLASPTGL
jgi:hypothetical protein